ncbi:MAG TPA: hypothetical protein VKP65_11105 [Rhodothermales bacterium]|nr:hypothetical protein [Rhodothermales bacterium]
MNTSRFLLLLLAAVLCMPAMAQPLSARNTVYVQLGGNAIAYSLNYERLFTAHLTGRIGAMYAHLDVGDLEDVTETEGKETLVFVPVMVNYLLGTGKHRVELGAGPLLVTSDAGGGGIAATATAGYLYRPNRGFNARLGFTPAFSTGFFLPWGGVGLGYSF